MPNSVTQLQNALRNIDKTTGITRSNPTQTRSTFVRGFTEGQDSGGVLDDFSASLLNQFLNVSLGGQAGGLFSERNINSYTDALRGKSGRTSRGQQLSDLTKLLEGAGSRYL